MKCRPENATPWPGTDAPPAAVRDEVVLTYYSRTGTTANVAAGLAERFADPTVQRIRPDRERRYMDRLVGRVADTGADVVATLLVKRDRVGSSEYEAALDEFVSAMLDERH